ncbi:MAG: porin, partial [Alphaproteobacteria bacterium]|nr:porin [Alphaproteobacteria bacterium]
SATADDGRVENLKANGTTIWAGYRIPFGRVERKVSDGTEAYPIGSFNLFARYIENESIDLENDATEKADTQIYAVTYAAERKSYKVKLGWSHNINNFVNSALQDEEFERFSAGYDHRLSDKIWFEVEYATTSGKELLEDEDVIRVGFRLK